MLGTDTTLYKYLEKNERESLALIPALDMHPTLPSELVGLNALQQEFWIRQHPHAPSAYFLSHHPLNRLITFTKEEWHQLCRYLALFDLQEELKNVVQTRLFKAIKESLSDQEWGFLEYLRQIPNPIHLPKMHLGAWDYSKEALDTALFDRGKARLKGALAATYETLYNFIPNIFLPKEKKPSKEITDLLIQQVETVLNRAFTYAKHH